MDSQEQGNRELKAHTQLILNTTFLIVAFTIFTLLATINPSSLKNTPLLALELVLSIPFLTASSLIKIKQITNLDSRLIDKFGNVTYVVGYALLLNALSMVLVQIISLLIGIIFLIVNVIIALTYSCILIIEKKSSVRARALKDIFFIALIVLLGLLPLI